MKVHVSDEQLQRMAHVPDAFTKTALAYENTRRTRDMLQITLQNAIKTGKDGDYVHSILSNLVRITDVKKRLKLELVGQNANPQHNDQNVHGPEEKQSRKRGRESEYEPKDADQLVRVNIAKCG